MKIEFPKLKRILLFLFLGVVIFLSITFSIIYFQSTPTIFDRPSGLTNKIKKIDFLYVNWACDCPDFIELKLLNPEEKDYVFIEPANSNIIIPDSFYIKDHFNKKLRLTGHYYNTKGIPKTYEQKTPIKPEKAKVFRYYKFEIINKN